MVPVGESRIELLEPLSADSPIGKFLEKRGEGCITSPCMSTICRARWSA